MNKARLKKTRYVALRMSIDEYRELQKQFRASEEFSFSEFMRKKLFGKDAA